ncbi:HesA/MoeB/ThiF family protein [Histidinibacterium lentulum]|uniref:Molybdopterin-synthase adenylyltransferase n=1 Tax=Histidinibacterium lentulum TaxID=2480588 RepID=A0A3N2QRA6_9RHOB|nr:molybdopterin-synthase adenylyltransferase MoeB [Histidinibacterium lentulum]ROT97748.1 molybdopterin-synthase adenylyltransferase MoeB [Histidinibacterium lentulum]
MIMVLAMAGTLWGIGAVMGAPRQARWTMIGLLLVAVIALQVVLPEGHPLREATGSSPALWVLVLAAAALVRLYATGLGRVRARAQEAEAARERQVPDGGTFSPVELNRYARHMVLREIGGPGQARLKRSRVLVVGAGGLGAPALLYLGAAGVGTLGVIDGDEVDGSNLQRQVIHRDARIGMPKVFSAQGALAELNPFVTVRPYHRRLTEEIAEGLFADYDLVLDGSDNSETRYLVNRVAARLGLPVVGAALTQWEGQISVWDPARGAPCYECVFPVAAAPELAPACAEAGVLGPLPGVMGSMMAVEAVKVLTDAGTPLRGRVLLYDALHAETRIIGAARRADCPACGLGAAGPGG